MKTLNKIVLIVIALLFVSSNSISAQDKKE